MRITRNLFAAIFTVAFMQNAFADAEPPKPADCAAAPDAAAKDACLKKAAEAVKAAQQAKAADAKPVDKGKADKPKEKASPKPKCPSAEEWQKLLTGKDTEIGELKAKVVEVTKARDEFESKAKKAEAELAGANEEASASTAAANEAITERDAKVAEAKDAQNACAASFEARIRASESAARDANARADAAEAKATAAEQALVAARDAKKPAPPVGGQPPAPPKPTVEIPEDLKLCVERLMAVPSYKGGAEVAIKRCNKRVLALRSGK